MKMYTQQLAGFAYLYVWTKHEAEQVDEFRNRTTGKRVLDVVCTDSKQLNAMADYARNVGLKVREFGNHNSLRIHEPIERTVK